MAKRTKRIEDTARLMAFVDSLAYSPSPYARCLKVFNSFGHVCARPFAHAGPCNTTSTVETR